MKKLLIPSLTAVAFLAVTGCVDREAIRQSERTKEIIGDTKIPVSTTAVYPRVVEDTLEVTGSIAANDDTTVSALTAGKVVSLMVKDGDVVRAGQTLIIQDSTDAQNRLRQAQAGVDSARSQLQSARNDAAAAPGRSAAAVRAAQARVNQATEAVKKARAGSRDQERKLAQIQVERADSDLKTAKLALDRGERLFNEGAIAKADLELLQNRYDNAMAAYKLAVENKSLAEDAVRPEDLRIAQQELAAATEALRIERNNRSLDANFTERVNSARASLTSAEEQVRIARKAITDAVIRAPISGRISGRPAQVGTVLAPGSPAARIVGIQDLYFEPEITEEQVAKVRSGMSVRVSVEAIGQQELRGIIAAVNPVASNVGRLYKVRVKLMDSLDKLRPGMFAKGRMVIGTRENVYVVPDATIKRDGSRAWALIASDGKAAKRPIEVIRMLGGEVQTTGFRPGDELITTGQENLLEGEKIKIEKPETAEAKDGDKK